MISSDPRVLRNDLNLLETLFRRAVHDGDVVSARAIARVEEHRRVALEWLERRSPEW